MLYELNDGKNENHAIYDGYSGRKSIRVGETEIPLYVLMFISKLDEGSHELLVVKKNGVIFLYAK